MNLIWYGGLFRIRNTFIRQPWAKAHWERRGDTESAEAVPSQDEECSHFAESTGPCTEFSRSGHLLSLCQRSQSERHRLLSSLLWLHMLPACWPLPSHRCICQHTVRIKNAGSFSIAFRGNPISKFMIRFLHFSHILEKKGRPWFTFFLSDYFVIIICNTKGRKISSPLINQDIK